MPVQRIAVFDTWRPGYGGDTVNIYLVGSTTLASVFTDEALTAAASNPQTLSTKTIAGVDYGKFAQPLYTEQAIELNINSLDQTGVQRPALTTLDAQDGSKAVVTVDGGSKSIAIEDHLARRIDARDFGDFIAVGGVGASASTNTATLTTAIGVATAAGGGDVYVPGGTYQITTFTIPEGVALRGADREGTILQSTEASEIVTITGARAGLRNITLDGVSQASGSVGLYAVAVDELILDHVEFKRFETGMLIRGGADSIWINVVWNDCVTGAHLRGDLDSGNSSTGKVFQHNLILGGIVKNCSTAGLIFENIDLECDHNSLENVSFDTNTGTALKVIGARFLRLRNALFTTNTANISMEDGSPETATNTLIDFSMDGGHIAGGTMALSGTLGNVGFSRVDFSDVDITITTPINNILALDCLEDVNVTLAGTTTAWVRRRSIDDGAATGLTSGNAATKAWAITPAAGERLYLEANVVGRQRNGVNDGFYHIAVSAERPAATMAYDTQTANFTVGDVLTGGTSGATARIVADSDSGATGTLSLQDLVGTFVDNEIITDVAGGSATVNGSAATGNAALVGSVTAIRAAEETNANWAATFVANGPEIEVQVTGDTSQTVEWKTHVKVVSL